MLLVSLTKDISLAQLAPVSAAIQKQISRDFGPIWNVEATVDAFEKLEDVPVGYWHVLLQDELPNSAAGLHKRDDNKQPFALVALTNNWPVFMSHEVLEMLVDPQGTLTRAGNSLKSGQGRVEYLIEVCDPCQASKFAYSVNSVLVSDFYTPNYFDPVKSSAVRYSFSGQIGGPREVLDGGYLSWFDPQTRHLFRLTVDGKKRAIDDKGEVPFAAESLRAFSDRVSADRRGHKRRFARRIAFAGCERLSPYGSRPEPATDSGGRCAECACPQPPGSTRTSRCGRMKLSVKGV